MNEFILLIHTKINNLVLKNIKPSRSFETDKEDSDNKEYSALDSLGLKPKPAI